VKFTDEERARLKALATSLGWSESQVVRDSVAAIIFLVQHPDTDDLPKLIGLARQALLHEGDDSLLRLHLGKICR
jgi:hypothetical protein